ncbi:acyl-CoA dehydrogenase family protein [Umboniibacter marinipuniceus]|uniref:Alkylation response protein AidB-like acyl-CoA dehydrogenase n=1 Tax=Umboniibacter marinipuniceus TaxID=569599 RepID=A0A3M0AB40_9GAMM|nr:acyl-CoA dehydrogenase family protein [Umboniibacter marinipuniceus]RMA82383.1 alkylation response protein AidB-like acyl-CoA dehydrogenase [Umboniibacter marinipuniceus]
MSEEITLFKDMVLRFFEQEVAPNYEQWEQDHCMPRDFWRTMGEAGLLLVDMPEEFGGSETSVDVALMIMEELSRCGYFGLATGYNIHANIVAPYVMNIGNDDQRARWLPGMASGDIVTALGMTEPGAGSDVAGMRSTAIREGEFYRLNGSKIFITNGIHADMVIVCAKTDPAAGAKGISLFLVDTSLPGFSKGKKLEKMGQHSSDTAELFFEDVMVPAECLLGEEGKGFMYLMQELPRERLGCAIQAIGHAQGALDMTCEYVTDRKAFGQSIAQFQNTRFKLAELKTELEMCRALYEKLKGKFAEDQMTVDDGAMIKLASTEMELKMVDTCLQLHGGYGYTDEYEISRFYRDARVQTIYAGSSEIMKEVVARSILGR